MMKNRVKQIIYWVIVFVLTTNSSCKDDEVPTVPPNITPFTPKSAVIWKTEKDYGLASNNFVYENLLIQGTVSTKGFTVMALTVDSGKIVWENFDYKSDLGGYPTGVGNSTVCENYLILSSPVNLMVIDLSNGSTVWKSILNKGLDNICVFDGWIYKSDYRGSEGKSTLHRYKLETGVHEEVFSISFFEQGDELFFPKLRMPVKWVSPDGDDLLVMHNRSFGHGTNGLPRMDILAYNLTADSLEWYRKGVDAESSVSRPAIDGQKVYFYGLWHAYCIDAATGNTIWKYYVGESVGGDFNTANILIVDDKLIVKQENDRMTAVDKETGEKIWYNPNTLPMPHLLREHNDTIWMASGDVLAVDANTGEELIRWSLESGSWIFPVLPHPTNGKIYTTDGSFIYCLDPQYMK